MQLAWIDFKAIVNSKYLSIQYIEDSGFYYLTIFDGPQELECRLDKNPTDPTDLNDFINNYKSKGNQSFSDIDGTPFMRLKASKKGWSFWAVPIEITTSTLLGSLFCKDSTGVDIPGLSCKIYNGSDVEITTAGLLNANLNTCVKTVLDFEPEFDYELIGGSLRIANNPGTDVRIWIIGAPDIPAQYGGSKEFASGINLKYLSPNNAFDIDGRVTKYITYNSQTHQGKLRIILKHPAGANINLQFVIHAYRL